MKPVNPNNPTESTYREDRKVTETPSELQGYRVMRAQDIEAAFQGTLHHGTIAAGQRKSQSSIVAAFT